MSVPNPIKHVLIACHPSPQSLTMSVAERYTQTALGVGDEVVMRDLYRMGFDPVLKDTERPASYRHSIAADVADELTLLKDADVLVLLYPIWFGTPPAMLKGYIERVLGCDVTFEAVRDRKAHPLFSGKLLVSFSLSGTSNAWLHEQGALLSLRNLYDTYLKNAFSFADALHFHFDSIPEAMAPRFADEILFEVEKRTREICSRFSRGLASRPAGKK